MVALCGGSSSAYRGKPFDDSLISALLGDGSNPGANLVVLAGAGVSHDAPACLPLGSELTDYYLSSCIGQAAARRTHERWSEISGSVAAEVDVSCPLIRLESVIEKIDDVDMEFGWPRMMGGFRTFSDVEPNECHCHLSSLMQAGAELITPNFDCGIERALDSQFGGVGCAAPTFREDLGLSVGEAAGKCVYHYHGTGFDVNGMGATVSRIRRGFAPGFKALLRRWFEEGRALLCVGFSCSDFFDATQFFESQPKGSWSGAAVFLNHCVDGSWPGRPEASALAERQLRFMGAFAKAHVAYGLTSQVLFDLVERALGHERAEAGRSAAERGIKRRGESWERWKGGFDVLSCDGERDKRLYAVRLFNQFGFYPTDEDVAEVNAGGGADGPLGGIVSFSECVDAAAGAFRGVAERLGEAYFLDERFSTQSRSVGFDFMMLRLDMQNLGSDSQWVGDAYARAFAARGNPSVDLLGLPEITREVEQCVADEHKRLSTSYLVGFNKLCKKACADAILRREDVQSREHLTSFLSCAEQLRGLLMSQYVFVSHICSLLKRYNELCVLLGEEQRGLVSVADLASLALEVCYTDEIARVYRHEALLDALRLLLFDERGAAAADRALLVGSARRWLAALDRYLSVLRVRGSYAGNEDWRNRAAPLLELPTLDSSHARSEIAALLGL